MNIETLDSEKDLFLVGDIHGDWRELLFQIQQHKIVNSYIISVGDIGIGFQYNEELEHKTCTKLNEAFRESNIIFCGIRGNHDDPKYFKDKKVIELSNFKLLRDYTVFNYNSKLIQLIGGAVSIDRTGREVNRSYWTDEGVAYNKEACKKVDVLITHTAPSFCYPQTFNEMVYGWAKEDAYLIKDLTEERAVLDEIFKVCQPALHFYGHFHSSHVESIGTCVHRLLDIDELFLLSL